MLPYTMLNVKRRLIKKLKPPYKSQLGQLWICLVLLILLCMMFQIVEKLQSPSNCRCDEKLKRQTLQKTIGNETLFQPEKGPNCNQTPNLPASDIPQSSQKKAVSNLGSTENILHILKLRQAFGKTKLLDRSLDSQEGFWKKHHEENGKKPWTSCASKKLKSQPLVSKRAPKSGHVGRTVIPQNRKPRTTQKAAEPFSKKPVFTNRVAVNEQTAKASSAQARRSLQGHPQKTSSHSLGKDSAFTLTTIPIPKTPRVSKAKEPPETAPLRMQRESSPSKTVAPQAGGAVEDIKGDNWQTLGNSSDEAACKPKTHIVFLKVHKSASSTVMNILFRFGETRNLTFAFPFNGASQLFYPHFFAAEFVEGFVAGQASQFNILCHHMRFLPTEVQRVMPSTTFYFAILRNPVHLMESSFTYYKGTSAFFHSKSLEEFLQQPSRFYKAGDSDSQYAKNLMTFDFGFNHNGEASARHVQLMLQAIKTAFNLILISEYFDESMVLLKEALCWDLDSVVSFPLNSRDGSTRAPLPDFTVEKIKNWNKLDWEIYTHFNQTFWEKIDRDIGRKRMSQEVRALQKRREQLARTCLQEGESVAPQEIKDQSLLPLQYGQARILGYNLKPGLDKKTEQMCRRLITPELQYSRSLYSRQFPQKALKGHRPASLPRKHNRRTV